MADSAMDCRKAGTLLNAYLDGELDLSASLELEAHLADCAACRAERETLSRLSRRLREGLTRHEAPAELKQRLTRLTAVPRPAAQTLDACAPGNEDANECQGPETGRSLKLADAALDCPRVRAQAEDAGAQIPLDMMPLDARST